MIPSDQSPAGTDWISRRLTALEGLVRELQAGRRLEAATIGAGGLRVKGGDITVLDGGDIAIEGGGSVTVDGGDITVIDAAGNIIGQIGDLGNGKRGFILRRAGGYPALEVSGTGVGSDYGFVGMYDVSGNYIVTDDAASGRGLARPYIPIQVGEVSVPTAVATSTGFADLHVGAAVLQHPVLYAYVLIRSSDSSTTGEVRMAVDGIGVGPTLPVNAGAYAYVNVGPFALPSSVLGNYSAIQVLSVQARRTAGTGTIGVRPLSILGLESSRAL
ncbi:hypothetical protein [Micromonospora sp. NPDC050200]|uniref:hypothetical protein n=1 Tax=Micromonospora sp. NPDC050200 TaxID=3155664 RepID=UPI0033F6F3E6